MEDLRTGLASLDISVSSLPSRVETVTQDDTKVQGNKPQPLEVKQEPTDEHPVDAGIKCEDITECLRAKLSDLKIKIEHGHEEDVHSTGSLSNSEPQTPACKGYTIEWDFVSRFFGPCQYFTAPIERRHGFSQYAVFSLSASQRMVSIVGDNSTHCCYPTLDDHYGSIVRFEIGGLTYRWDTQINTLAFEHPAPEHGLFGPTPQLSYVELLDDLNATKDLAKRFQEQSQHFPVVMPNNANTVPVGRDRPCWGLRNGGYVNGSSSPESSPIESDFSLSPPAEVLHSPRETTPPQGPTEYFFGESPSQEDIDNWVDQAAAARRVAHETGNMKCPEAGCGASSRRPHALKTHLYAHYGIKPIKCSMCGLRVLTEANLSRHVKNVHVCPGCPGSPPMLDMKAHKSTCRQAAKAVAANKRKKDRSGTPAVPPPIMPVQLHRGFYSTRTH